jgi:DNA-binding GntR family transcriptional regulator
MRQSELDSSGRHKQLSEKVANRIREKIMVGELRPGFLRTERLAEDLGVSPTPVREALMILQAEGAVQWEPRRGFRLQPMTAQDVADLYDVQAYIAGELAARAVAVLSTEEIDRLEAIQAELREAAHRGDVDLVGELNHEIHRTINSASGSARMTTLLRQTVQYVPLGFFGRIEGWADASAHDHSAIFTALRTRSRPAARKAMAEHIRHIGTLLLEHLKSQDVLQ